jgi:predicted amidophosphoribosyltransferase
MTPISSIRPVPPRWRAPLWFVLDLLLPSRCVGCAAPRGPVCGRCAAGFSAPMRVHRPAFATGPPVFALADYAGAARRLVISYKERGRRDLAGPLGRLVAAGYARLPIVTEGAVTFVPVPSRPGIARQRGGQHMLRLARRCAAALAGHGVSTSVAPALRLDHGARDSVGLDPAERAANLAGRLRYVGAASVPRGTSVVLVDDVVTTGATVAACCGALASAGVRVAAVLACTSTAGGVHDVVRHAVVRSPTRVKSGNGNHAGGGDVHWT